MLNPELPNFAEELRALVGNDDKLPPVESWHPERVGEIDIVITAEGDWHYQGELMERMAVVKLLSRILVKEGDDYFLVSPQEKLRIQVDDAPFVVRMMDVEEVSGSEQSIHLSTSVGDSFTLDTDHPLSLVSKADGSSVPYVEVRRGLQAKLSRSVYYELAEYAQESEAGHYGVWSRGQFFVLG